MVVPLDVGVEEFMGEEIKIDPSEEIEILGTPDKFLGQLDLDTIEEGSAAAAAASSLPNETGIIDEYPLG